MSEGMASVSKTRRVGHERGRVCALEVKGRVDVAEHFGVGMDDLLQVDVDEVVERVNVLLHQPAHLQKRRQELPFVLEKVAFYVRVSSKKGAEFAPGQARARDGAGQRLLCTTTSENAPECCQPRRS